MKVSCCLREGEVFIPQGTSREQLDELLRDEGAIWAGDFPSGEEASEGKGEEEK